MEDEPITEFQSLSPYYFKIALFTQLLNPVHSLIHTQEFKEGFVTHSFSDVAQNLFKILLHLFYFKIALFTQLLNPVHSLIHTQEFKEGFVTHSFSDVAQNLFKILLHLLARMEQDFESFSQDSVFLFD